MRNHPILDALASYLQRGGGESTRHVHCGPPPRAIMAFNLLGLFTEKTQERCVANNVGFETIDGQNLTIGELRVQDAACDTLVKYLQGGLQPDVWDAEHMPCYTSAPAERGAQRPLISRCPFCLDKTPDRKCQACNGHGVIQSFPLQEERE